MLESGATLWSPDQYTPVQWALGEDNVLKPHLANETTRECYMLIIACKTQKPFSPCDFIHNRNRIETVWLGGSCRRNHARMVDMDESVQRGMHAS